MPPSLTHTNLTAWLRGFQENWARFEEALSKDLGRHALEAALLELNGSVSECVEAYHHVATWAKPERPPFNVQWSAMRPVLNKTPKGVVLIIGPYNVSVDLRAFCVLLASPNRRVQYPILCSINIMASIRFACHHALLIPGNGLDWCHCGWLPGCRQNERTGASRFQPGGRAIPAVHGSGPLSDRQWGNSGDDCLA